MPKDRSVTTQFAEALNNFKADFVPKVAELQRPVLGNVPVSKAERQQRFWQEDPGWTREQELYLLGHNPDGSQRVDAQGKPVEGLSREDVGLLKHPFREIDSKAGGRANDIRAQHRYMQELADLGPPPPDPLQAAAHQVEQANPPSSSPALGIPGSPPIPQPIPQSPAAPLLHPASSVVLPPMIPTVGG